jgi:flagellar hook-associated protein 3 FlgL
MRMTLGMIMDNYNSTLSDNLNLLNSSFSQISSQKKFSRASEDPTAAMQTLNSLHNINDLQQYKTNIDQTTSLMNTTESTVNTVNQIVVSAQETITAANNSGALSDTDNQTHALSLQSLQGEILQTLNTTSGSSYVFGGSQDGPAPFRAGVAADGATPDGVTNEGKLMYYNSKGTPPGYIPFRTINTTNVDAMQVSMPVDVGLGMQVDSTGKVAAGTAFESATSAIDMLSSSMTATGNQNIYDTLGSAVTKLQVGGAVDLGTELADSQKEYSSVLSTTVSIGEKTKMLTFLGDRNTTQDSNQQTRLSQVSDVDTTKAITDYQMRQMVYQASLSVGTKIMQPTLFDFMK